MSQYLSEVLSTRSSRTLYMKSGCLVDLVSRPDLVIVGNFTQVRGVARDRRSGFFCGDEPDAVTSGGATCTSSESGGSTGSRGTDMVPLLDLVKVGRRATVTRDVAYQLVDDT